MMQNYSYLLSEVGGHGDGMMNGGDMSSGDSMRTATDDFTAIGPLPAGPHMMTGLSPWPDASNSVFAPGQFDHLGGHPFSLRTVMCPVAGAEHPRNNQSFVGHNSELGGALEFPILNHTVSIPSVPTFSRSTRFAGIDPCAIYAPHLNISEVNRPLDGILNKGMCPIHGAYNNNPKQASMGNINDQLFSVYGCCRENEADISDTEVENMRRVLGKAFNRSPSKFTLMGEPIEKSVETPSSPGFDYHNHLKEMIALAPPSGSDPRGLFALGPGFANNAAPTWHDDDLASLSTASVNGYISCGSTGSDNNPAKHAASPRAESKSDAVKRKDRNGGNVFPTNVKSLLSTGIFDGVPVKYVSWDRTKSVRGTIQGTGYLCWCKECGKKKVVSAYQLEQHAGAKSKQPNNHIHFSNGKSVHGAVQELHNTPSDKLLEVIPAVTGCGINDANFSQWKGSFQAVQRELERIFGSDPEEPSSS